MKPKLIFVIRVAVCIPLILLMACNGPIALTSQPNTPVVQLRTETLAATHTPSLTPTFQSAIKSLPTLPPSSTETILPADVFAFGPTPQGGQIDGISGVFVHEEFSSGGKTYNVFRFYSDGLVLSVSLSLQGSVLENWPNISKWFYRDSQNDGISRGEVYLLGDHIWFRTTVNITSTGEVVVIDYSGTYLGSKLILDSYSHYNGHKVTGGEFVQENVDQ